MRELHETRKPTDAKISPTVNLVRLCDEFSEFNDYCAFFCKAASLIATDEEPLDGDAAEGLERYAYALQKKSQLLKRWLHEIQAGR